MRPDKSFHLHVGRRLYQWAMNHLAWLFQLKAEGPRSDKPYPDYVTCPFCGELEVEVWSDQKQGRCHNCQRIFAYPLPREERD